VVLRLRFDDFTRATRSHTLPEPTSHTLTILTTARGLLAAAMPMIRRQGITLIGVTLGNLDAGSAVQLALPFERPRSYAVDAVVDGVRDKFGSKAITRGVLLNRGEDLTAPLLPD
jgi:DNA polymerase IV